METMPHRLRRLGCTSPDEVHHAVYCAGHVADVANFTLRDVGDVAYVAESVVPNRALPHVSGGVLPRQPLCDAQLPQAGMTSEGICMSCVPAGATAGPLLRTGHAARSTPATAAPRPRRAVLSRILFLTRFADAGTLVFMMIRAFQPPVREPESHWHIPLTPARDRSPSCKSLCRAARREPEPSRARSAAALSTGTPTSEQLRGSGLSSLRVLTGSRRIGVRCFSGATRIAWSVAKSCARASSCDQRVLSQAGSSLQFRATTSFLLDGVLDPWLRLNFHPPWS